MAASEAEPDLHNVDYEDVLHLYRGWRKAEGALKEKNKELNALKIRVKQLQESHIKFGNGGKWSVRRPDQCIPYK